MCPLRNVRHASRRKPPRTRAMAGGTAGSDPAVDPNNPA